MSEPSTLKLLCPDCKTGVLRVPFMTDATVEVHRSCPTDECARWRILMKPKRLPRKLGFAHEVTFFREGPAQRRT